MVSGWTEINGVDELPLGTWLVEVATHDYWTPHHVAIKCKGTTTVGGAFHYDMPKIIAYMPIPGK